MEEIKKTSKFFPCNCLGTCGGLFVTAWEDEEEISFSIFKRLDDSNFSFRDKLRYIFDILRIGHPYDDEVILTKNDMDELIQFLIEKKGEYT